jgi:hypothetical protein
MSTSAARPDASAGADAWLGWGEFVDGRHDQDDVERDQRGHQPEPAVVGVLSGAAVGVVGGWNSMSTVSIASAAAPRRDTCEATRSSPRGMWRTLPDVPRLR